MVCDKSIWLFGFSFHRETTPLPLLKALLFLIAVHTDAVPADLVPCL